MKLIKYDVNVAKRKGTMFKSLKESTPQDFIFWDIETFVNPVKYGNMFPFRLACFASVRLNEDGHITNVKCDTVHTEEDLVDYVMNKLIEKTSITMMAHNTPFDLDHSHLLQHMIAHGFKVSSWYSKATTTVIVLKRKKLKLTILDSMNWFNVPLAKIAESLGEQKIDVNFENCTTEELEAHCLKDVEILVKMFSRYKKLFSTAFRTNISYTRAGDAIRLFRGSKAADKVHYNNDSDIISREFASYLGGRVELYRLGILPTKQYHKLDFNSLYPSVMIANKYSVELISSGVPKKYPDIDKIRKCCNVMIDVSVNTKENCFGIRTKDGLIFPTGKFRTHLVGDEAQYCLDHKLYDKIHKIWVYRKADIFSELLTKIYDLRVKYKTEKNDTFQYALKLLMNSIYGKFGQKTGDFKIVGKTDKIDYGTLDEFNADDESMVVHRVLEGVIYDATDNVITAHTSPIIVSEITANARLKLYKAMKMAGENNVFYCDTDSIFTNDIGLERLELIIDDNKIGYLKLEESSHAVEIIALKSYTFGNTSKLKGVPDSAEQIGYKKYIYNRFNTLHNSLFANKKIDEDSYWQVKELLGVYSKGLIMKDGTITPWKLG